MNFNEWVNSVDGQAIDIDGNWGAQCWDLWCHYAMNVFGASMWQASTDSGGNVHVSGYACGIWHGFGGNLNWAFSPIGADQPAQRGDVAIWEYGSAVGPNSHVAIVLEDRGGNVYCLTQNPGATRRANLSKDGILGYLRPDNQSIFDGYEGAGAIVHTHSVSGSISELAAAVLRGDFGNGPARQAALGDKYDAVQAEVNNILNGTPTVEVTPAPVTSNPAVVQPGDGYWNVAERVWGGDNATITANMNKLIDINGGVRLFAGMELQTEYPAPAPIVETPTVVVEETPAAVTEQPKYIDNGVQVILNPEASVSPVEASASSSEVAVSDATTNVSETPSEANQNPLTVFIDGIKQTLTNIGDKMSTPQSVVYTPEQISALASEADTATGGTNASKYKLFTREFWTYAGERAIKTFAYSANSLLVTNGLGIINVDWIGIVSAAAVATVSSVAVCLSTFKSSLGE